VEAHVCSAPGGTAATEHQVPGRARVGVILRHVQRAAARGDQRQRHNLLVHWRDAGPCAVRAHLHGSMGA
jgi:hypothetical protein